MIAERRPDDRLFADRGVAHLVAPKPLVESGRHLEHAPDFGDIFAEEDHIGVAGEFVRQCLRHCFTIRHFGHGRLSFVVHISVEGFERRERFIFRPFDRIDDGGFGGLAQFSKFNLIQLTVRDHAILQDRDRVALPPFIQFTGFAIRRGIRARVSAKAIGLAFDQAGTIPRARDPPPS